MRIALLLAVAMLVYGNTVLNGFALDDSLYLLNNPKVTSPSLRGLFTPTKIPVVFRPVTFSTLALNWAVGGMHAWGYHVVNLLLHAAVTWLLYLVLKKLLEAVPRGTTVAWVAALLFAVHPIHSEAVASIVGRSEMLAAGFLLGAWLLHLQDQPVPALACFVLALLAKESAVAFVPLVVAGDYARGKLKQLPRYAAIAGIAVAYLALLWKVQGGRFGDKNVNFMDNPLAHLPASLRILNALRVAWKYVGLHLFPATLSCDYSYNSILLYVNLRHTGPPAIAALAALALWIWAARAQKKEWALAGAVYMAGFAATANILVPTGTIMGERLAYLPSVGFCLLAALIWIRLEDHNGRLAWLLLATIVAILGIRTMVRNQDWRDNFALFSSAVRAVPGSTKAHAGLGDEYLARDQLDEARSEYQTALRIYPQYPEVVNSYGVVESRMGHDEEALRLMEKALSMTGTEDPTYAYVGVNLAAQLIKLGRNDEALVLLDKEIVTAPGNTRVWSNRAVVRYRRGEEESARTDAAVALRLDATNTQALNLLSLLNKPGLVAPQP